MNFTLFKYPFVHFKYLFLIFFFSLLTEKITVQEVLNIDSLKQLLAKAEGKQKIDLINTLS